MMSKWFCLSWYHYLFEKPSWYSKGYCSWTCRLWCRIKGHPTGPVWYNPGGLEPNMRCKNCGEDLG